MLCLIQKLHLQCLVCVIRHPKPCSIGVASPHLPPPSRVPMRGMHLPRPQLINSQVKKEPRSSRLLYSSHPT